VGFENWVPRMYSMINFDIWERGLKRTNYPRLRSFFEKIKSTARIG